MVWLSQIEEEIVEPDRLIVDTHFHLWQERPPFCRYLLDDVWADTGSGHKIEQLVFLECASEYLQEGPESLRPIGETRFVAEAAARAAAAPAGAARIGAIVGTANLMLGAAVDEVLQAQRQAGDGLFRGIRYGASWDACEEIPNARTGFQPHVYADATFREGFSRLAPQGLSFDAWNYHPQIGELAELAQAFPNTTIVSNHLGGILGIGPYADRREAIFETWKQEIQALSECPNVIIKLGGLAQPTNGFGWEDRPLPPTSDEFVDTYRPYYLFAIEQFGPDRCMFESNFPVDRISVSYQVLWNTFKKMVLSFSESEKAALFRETAMRVYRLEPV